MGSTAPTLDALYRRRRFGIRPGLDVMSALLDALGHPEQRFPALHVTGSKGKGSVATMAQTILTAHGLRTGLYTSPHLESYRERMRVDGRDHRHGRGRARARPGRTRWRRDARGGRRDRPPSDVLRSRRPRSRSTGSPARRSRPRWSRSGSAVASMRPTSWTAKVGVVTSIELEHTELLGDSLAAIAPGEIRDPPSGDDGGHRRAPARGARRRRLRGEAARSAVVAPGRRRSRSTLATSPRTGSGSMSTCPVDTTEGISLPLHGRFQPGNAAMALAAVVRFGESTGLTVEDRRVRSALAGVVWPGRLQRVGRSTRALLRRRPHS